jgi:hypothetical protein
MVSLKPCHMVVEGLDRIAEGEAEVQEARRDLMERERVRKAFPGAFQGCAGIDGFDRAVQDQRGAIARYRAKGSIT